MTYKKQAMTVRNMIEAEEDALMDFQFAIIDALRTQGLSKAEFAEILGVSRSRVSQMLNSTANPTLKLVGRALAVLGIKNTYRQQAADVASNVRTMPTLEYIAAHRPVEAPEVSDVVSHQFVGVFRHFSQAYSQWHRDGGHIANTNVADYCERKVA